MGNTQWLLNWTMKDNWWRTNSVKRWATTLGEIQRRIRVTWAKPTGTLIEPQWISKGDNREGIHQGQETKGEQRKAHKWYKNPWWSAEWIMKQFREEHTQRVNPNAIRCHIGNNPWQQELNHIRGGTIERKAITKVKRTKCDMQNEGSHAGYKTQWHKSDHKMQMVERSIVRWEHTQRVRNQMRYAKSRRVTQYPRRY